MQTENAAYAEGQVKIQPQWRHAPWWIKAGAQATLALLPFGEALNHQLQIWNGFHTNFRWFVECNIKYLCDIAQTTARCGLQLHGAKTLEVGTGWIPTVPLGMHLFGAEVHTYDHVRHLRTANLAKLVELYPQYLPALAEAGGLQVGTLEERLRQFTLRESSAVEDWMGPAGIYYHAPGDASRSELRDGTLDLYFSVAVMEHVSVEAVKGMLREANRTLRMGGLTYHVIGMFDHFTSVDPSITRVNFLKFSDFTWRMLGQNKIFFHNRLRESEFIALFEEAGFEVLERRSEVDEASLKALETMRLNAKYYKFEKRDLATFGGIYAAKKVR